MIPPLKLKEYLENKVIQIAPLAFMRGRTLNDAVIILDPVNRGVIDNALKKGIKNFIGGNCTNSIM